MNKFDIDNFIELVEANKLDDASQKLGNYFDKLTPAEKGKVYVDIAGIYMRMIAENNMRLVEFLDAQLARLREIDEIESNASNQIKDRFDLADLRKKLQ